jgi:hypothetical protein
MSEIRRINFYGGPGCSKSTIATGIFSELKKLNFDIEYVSEYIKTWAHQKKVPKDFDQLYIFGKQLYKEARLLPHVKYIITDSPVLLNVAYAKKYNCSYADECLKIGMQFEEKYPAINIFLDRTGLPYIEAGRYENLDEAKIMDDYIFKTLENKVNLHTFYSVDHLIITQFIKDTLNG